MSSTIRTLNHEPVIPKETQRSPTAQRLDEGHGTPARAQHNYTRFGCGLAAAAIVHWQL